MIALPSSRTVFAGVAEFYDATLAPLMIGAEKRRRLALVDAGMIAIVALATVAWLLNRGGDTGVIAAMIAGAVGLAMAGARINKTRGELTQDILSRLAEYFSYEYTQKSPRPAYAEPFIKYGLLSRFNREHWEDEITGAHAGVGFSLIEAHLKYRAGGRRKRTRTVFHGQLIAIEYKQRFTGTTIVKRDAGLLNGFAKPEVSFQRVGLASPEFEKTFEAWSTDQVEARTLLDPIMLERFDELERLHHGSKLQAAFIDGKLYVALSAGDKLSFGAMFRPINGALRVERLLKEFDLIFDLIDVATRPAAGLLTEALTVQDVRTG